MFTDVFPATIADSILNNAPTNVGFTLPGPALGGPLSAPILPTLRAVKLLPPRPTQASSPALPMRQATALFPARSQDLAHRISLIPTTS